jgi:hypothetical protein
MPSQKRPISLLNFQNGENNEIVTRAESTGKPNNGYRNDSKSRYDNSINNNIN